jgi:hypothetical protein
MAMEEKGESGEKSENSYGMYSSKDSENQKMIFKTNALWIRIQLT